MFKMEIDSPTPAMAVNIMTGPLEAILVIFGGSVLIMLFERSWKNMKNDTTFVCMRSSENLGDAKSR